MTPEGWYMAFWIKYAAVAFGAFLVALSPIYVLLFLIWRQFR